MKSNYFSNKTFTKINTGMKWLNYLNNPDISLNIYMYANVEKNIYCHYESILIYHIYAVVINKSTQPA